MPRPRATAVTATTTNGTTAATNADTDGADANEQSKPCWKDRLTEQQLTRKRVADRRLVRESRSRARKTIVVLQERIDALCSQQPDRLITDLMQEIAVLEKDKSALRDRLQTIYLAGGLSRDETDDMISRLDSSNTISVGDCQQESTITVATAIPRTTATATAVRTELDVQHEPSPPNSGTCAQSVDPVIALDQRMAFPDSPSPFPGIHANMDQTNCVVNFGDDEFLESIMVWKASQSKANDVFELASQLFHIDQGPSSLTRTRLAVLASTSSVLTLLIDDLHSPQSACNFPALCGASLPPASSQKGVSHLKRELTICAFEAVRPWCYSSTAAKVTMFWALYRILTLLVFPTPKNLLKCPVWYRPLLVQMWQPHPSFVDFIPWPRIRAHLVNDWESYRRRNLFSAFVENFDLDNAAEYRSRSLLRVSLNESELELDPQAERWFHDLSCLRMRRSFVERFPEFLHFVHVLDTNNDRGATKVTTSSNLIALRHPEEFPQNFASSRADDRRSPAQSKVPTMNPLDPHLLRQDYIPPAEKNVTPTEFTAEPKQSSKDLGGGTAGLTADGRMNHNPGDKQSNYGSCSTLHTLPDDTTSSRVPSMVLHGPGSGAMMGCTATETGFAQSCDGQLSNARPDDAKCHDAQSHDAPVFGDVFNGYHVDPSLIQWDFSAPWSMQFEDSKLGDLVFSV
ncbi:hypothetical protein LTR10_024160 [Elasticomyces elasticus]|uniref:BZIP domain-containing protein n=1 Tax=Exophiala sideris TaxID=1016849 RepID=A0ABR0IV05_9EURO|nr:hypothetical protein LTR10_024160 [Elasticomyces elasticus]KAK5020821.1 hypothetical protein LTS07_011410 [Exophiala sideris]KAK5022701.1 hypothetical protein LTR13_011433 [Exophiala sideris]KAK5048143.1 hypothetical protein LTR69_011429 [Exophiala sideris]KAK5176035.1 hypothetical protein LTR44_011411 [Eurotiomycetes sp. CCFEE 6388]